MTVNELYAALDALYPTSLSAPWDNDGRMMIPDGDKTVCRVLCCLDCDAGAIDRAIRFGADVIVSHHPLIFKPLYALDANDPLGAKIFTLIRSGIAVLSFHTRFDCGVHGVNELLADMLELTDVAEWTLDALPLGRIGKLPQELSGAELAELVKDRLGGAPLRIVCSEKRVRTVALVGGSGGSYCRNALAAGADAYITGEASHHQLLDAAEAGLCLITAGHDYTERAAARSLCATVQGLDPAIELYCYDQISIDSL